MCISVGRGRAGRVKLVYRRFRGHCAPIRGEQVVAGDAEPPMRKLILRARVNTRPPVSYLRSAGIGSSSGWPDRAFRYLRPTE
jgi:hypothetical protein